MEKDFDFSRLQSNLYLDLLTILEQKSGIAVTDDFLDASQGTFAVHTLEDLAIKWLASRTDRTIEGLLSHLWPILCEIAVGGPEELELFEDDPESLLSPMGLYDGLDSEPDTGMIHQGLVSCAMALVKQDAEISAMYSYHARYCHGFVEGVEAQRDNIEHGRAALSALGKAGADARHRENRDMKADARRHFLENRSAFATKDEAAQIISKNVVPVKFGTVRKWLVEKKES